MKGIAALLLLVCLFSPANAATVFRFGGHDPTLADTSYKCSIHKYLPLPTDTLTRHVIKIRVWPCAHMIDSTVTRTIKGAAWHDSVTAEGTCYCIAAVYYTRAQSKPSCVRGIMGIAGR